VILLSENLFSFEWIFTLIVDSYSSKAFIMAFQNKLPPKTTCTSGIVLLIYMQTNNCFAAQL